MKHKHISFNFNFFIIIPYALVLFVFCFGLIGWVGLNPGVQPGGTPGLVSESGCPGFSCSQKCICTVKTSVPVVPTHGVV